MVSNAIFNWTLQTYGKVNIDKMYERKVGEQLQSRLPHLPDRGKTAGEEREWKTIIHYVFHNRRKKSAAGMYHRHSIHENEITDVCRKLMDKGLSIHTHSSSDMQVNQVSSYQ